MESAPSEGPGLVTATHGLIGQTGQGQFTGLEILPSFGNTTNNVNQSVTSSQRTSRQTLNLSHIRLSGSC